MMPTSSTKRFDQFAHHLASLLPTWDLSRAEQDKAFVYESVVAGFLRLLRQAIQANREEDACNFYTQLYHHEEHSPRRYRMRGEGPQGYGSTLDDLLQIARLTVAGWCVRTVRTPSNELFATSDATAAAKVLQLCASMDYGVPELMRLWRLANQRPDPIDGQEARTLLDRLGVTRWESEIRMPNRPGFSEAYSPDYSWQLDGVLALMLHQDPPAYNWETVEEISVGFWDIGHVRTRLEELATSPGLRVEAEQVQDRIEKILSLIESQELAVAKRRLHGLVEASLDSEKWARLAKDTQTQFDRRKLRSSSLRECGIGDLEASSRSTPRIRRRWNLHKEDLATGFQEAHGAAQILAGDIGIYQDVASFALIERALIDDGVGMPQDTLEQSIQEAAESLSHNGWSPNVIIVPQGIEMRRLLRSAVAGSSTADVQHEYGPVASAFGCAVLEWPYTNPKSIVVCDSRGLIARVWLGDAPPLPALTLISANEEENLQILRHGEAAQTVKDVPPTSKISLLVEVAIAPEIGLGDARAGRALPLPDEARARIDT